MGNYTCDWVSWFEAQGRLVRVNPAILRRIGHTVDECPIAMPDYPLPLVDKQDMGDGGGTSETEES